MIKFDQVWSSFLKFSQVWSSLVKFNQVWSGLIKFDQVWLRWSRWSRWSRSGRGSGRGSEDCNPDYLQSEVNVMLWCSDGVFGCTGAEVGGVAVVGHWFLWGLRLKPCLRSWNLWVCDLNVHLYQWLSFICIWLEFLSVIIFYNLIEFWPATWP